MMKNSFFMPSPSILTIFPQTQIEVGEEGELLKSTTDLNADPTMVPFYPSSSDCPAQVRHIRRKQLVGASRMGVQVDLCDYTSTTGSPPKRVAFK